MIGSLRRLLGSMTWYLRSGIAPETARVENSSTLDDLKNMNHMASRKFAMTMVAVAIIAFMYFASVVLLFMLPGDPHVGALVNMYKDMIVAIASIAATLVGIQGLVDWKHNSDAQVSLTSQSVNEKRYVEEYLSGPKEDDYKLDIELVSKKKR
jgi:hypothetical protein